MTKIVGLSGGIGSGKSTVSRLLEKRGACVICADTIVHELQAPGAPMLDEIAAAFGPEVLDEAGALDRQAVAAIVFRDEGARTRLGQIVHPPVIAEMGRRAEEARAAGTALVVLDIPLLFEGAKAGRGAAVAFSFDATICVWVPPAQQLERTLARDGGSRDDVGATHRGPAADRREARDGGLRRRQLGLARRDRAASRGPGPEAHALSRVSVAPSTAP